MNNTKYLDMDGLSFLWEKLKKRFIQKDGNKVLSDNNYSNSEKAKVATISAISNTTIDKIFDS